MADTPRPDDKRQDEVRQSSRLGSEAGHAEGPEDGERWNAPPAVTAPRSRARKRAGGKADGQARLQADVGRARTGRPGPQRQARRAGRLRLRGDLRPLLPLARGAGPRALRLVGARRDRAGDPPHRPDDGGHLPDHALSPGDHRPGDGDHGRAVGRSFHPGPRCRRTSQRACRRRRLAGRRGASRAARRKPSTSSRACSPGRSRPSAASISGSTTPGCSTGPSASRGHRGRGRPRCRRGSRRKDRRPDRHRGREGPGQAYRLHRREGATLRRGRPVLRADRRAGPQDGAPLLPLVAVRLAGAGRAAARRGVRRRLRACLHRSRRQGGELRSVRRASSAKRSTSSPPSAATTSS